jgi:hypothetical protein
MRFPGVRSTTTGLRRALLATLVVPDLPAVGRPAPPGPDELAWQFWRPIEPELLAAQTPSVNKDADAEAVFWQVWVEDELMGGQDPRSVLKHYVRIKLFTARELEAQSHVDPTYGCRCGVHLRMDRVDGG